MRIRASVTTTLWYHSLCIASTAAAAATTTTTTAFHHPVAFSRTTPRRIVTKRCISILSSHDTNLEAVDESSSILEGLNPSQIQAVTQPRESITRVVAGPGAGKTRVLTCRISHLLQSTDRILAVTFTNKAANEMKERLGQQLGYGLTLGTFHSVCAKLLRWNGNLLSSLPSIVESAGTNVTLDGSFAILDQSDQLRVLKECLDEYDIDLKQKNMKPITVLQAMAYVKSVSYMGKQQADSQEQQHSKKALSVANKVYPLYSQLLLSQNCLDFDDLIYVSRELLLHHPDICQGLHRRWRHVLVDEFQDTSKAQLDLVKLWTSSSLFVVGDADQSIYSWRGANVESMSEFHLEFNQIMPVQTVYLMENYRSTTNIVNAAQRVISSSNSDSGTSQDDLRQDMCPMRGSGPSPRVIACSDTKSEAAKVVTTISEMINSGSLSLDNTVAIVYRTNMQSRALEEACVKNNLPYVLRSSAVSFYNRQEIKDCLCFIRWLHNERDSNAMMRAFKTPSRGIGAVALAEFKTYCDIVKVHCQENGRNAPTPLDILVGLSQGQDSSEDGLPHPSETISNRSMNRFLPFSTEIQTIRDQANVLNVKDLLLYIIDLLELQQHFDSISKSKSEYQDRWANVMELIQTAERYSNHGPALKDGTVEDLPTGSPLCNFLDDIFLVTDTAEKSSTEGRVVANLMTIHASKGMEFDAVFLVGNEEGTFPTNQAISEGKNQLEEEKRLCYVAMTRAKTHLMLTWRKEIQTFNGKKISYIEGRKSRFLDILTSKDKRPGDQKKHRKIGGKQRTPQSKDSSLPRRDNFNNQRRSMKTRSQSQNRLRRSNGSTGLQRATGSDTDYGRVQMGSPASPALANNGAAASHRNGVKMPFRAAPLVNGAGVRNDITRRTATRKKPAATVNGATKRTLTTARQKPAASSREAVDSTWFFPIGSSVVHRQRGKGLVLPPPPPNESGSLLVRVEFINGQQLDFPVEGTELEPDL